MHVTALVRIGSMCRDRPIGLTTAHQVGPADVWSVSTGGRVRADASRLVALTPADRNARAAAVSESLRRAASTCSLRTQRCPRCAARSPAADKHRLAELRQHGCRLLRTETTRRDCQDSGHQVLWLTTRLGPVDPA